MKAKLLNSVQRLFRRGQNHSHGCGINKKQEGLFHARPLEEGDTGVQILGRLTAGMNDVLFRGYVFLLQIGQQDLRIERSERPVFQAGAAVLRKNVRQMSDTVPDTG